MTLSRPALSVRRLLPLAALAGLTSGCEAISPYLPTVSFERLDVNDLGWEDVQADFIFRVENPNPIEIELARFDYALAFSEVEWVSGDDADGLVLDASAGSEVSLPLDITFSELYEAVQAVRGQDDIPFGLTGSFGFDTPYGIIDLPYKAEGDFPALRTPGIAYDQLRVSELDWTGATLDLDLELDNDHGSNITFSDFDFNVALNGTELGSGVLDLLAEVEGADTKVVTLPLQVSFVGAGAALYDVLVSDSAKLDLGASTNVDTPFGVLPLTIDESGSVSIQ